MKAKSSLVLALAAGAVCPVALAGEPTLETAFLPIPPVAKSISLNPLTGERTFGAPRTGYNLVWDSFSVTTGFYWGQDNPGAANPCTGAANDRLRTEGVNTGDLPNGTTGDCFRFHYFSPDILGAGGLTTIALSGFNVLFSFYNNWSDAHDLLDPTSTPPTVAAGYLLLGLAANPTYSWIYTVDLLAVGPTWSFTLAGSDEDGDGADDWGWGIRWDQSQATALGQVGPVICDAGPTSGSAAPGAENTFSRYIDAQLATPTCGFLWFGGVPWADFSMGIFSAGGGTTCNAGDCDGDTICDDQEADCDGDTVPDDCEVDCNGNGTPDDCETLDDCNNDGEADECDANHCAADLAAPFGGVLNVFDFLAFQTAFSNGESCADLAAPFGVFNVFDFLAFQTSFGNGC